MITENDLIEAIAECQGERNPNANTCIKLAAYLTIKESLFPKESLETPNPNQYSFAMTPSVVDESYFSTSDFSQAVKDKGIEKVFPVLDELMDTLIYINPKLYDSVMRKIAEI
jgi:hypothetical protein